MSNTVLNPEELVTNQDILNYLESLVDLNESNTDFDMIEHELEKDEISC